MFYLGNKSNLFFSKIIKYDNNFIAVPFKTIQVVKKFNNYKKDILSTAIEIKKKYL